jgi:HAD superfamily hydrolase (TIGR01549 family)
LTKTALLFDLDGTLLPMDREEFVRAYLPGVSAAAAALGDPKAIGRAILHGSNVMMEKTCGDETLEAVFWQAFEQASGISREASEPLFERYYEGEAFDAVRALTPMEPLVPQIIATARATGLRLILATSPLFPRIATGKRVLWAGLCAEDFEHITTYENYHAAKPHKAYYEELLDRLGLQAQECVMIGNDAVEDLRAPTELGMETFFLRNHAIIPEGYEYACDHEGDYAALLAWLERMTGYCACG